MHLNDSETETASNSGFETNIRKKSTRKAPNSSTSSQNTNVRKKLGKDKTVGAELLAKSQPPATPVEPDDTTCHNVNSVTNGFVSSARNLSQR